MAGAAGAASPKPRSGEGGGSPTFAGDVAPILYQKCVTCHRPGEAAPFALISYEDVTKKGRQIAKVTASRYMPPWHAAHGFGDFADERRLTDAEIDTIGKWVQAACRKAIAR
jgi:mono/diheme cytochrome c family protein